MSTATAPIPTQRVNRTIALTCIGVAATLGFASCQSRPEPHATSGAVSYLWNPVESWLPKFQVATLDNQSLAPEARQKVAHGVSRGVAFGNEPAPGGATESRSAFTATSLSPLPGLDRSILEPTAHAVGYVLPPLRGSEWEWQPTVASRRLIVTGGQTDQLPVVHRFVSEPILSGPGAFLDLVSTKYR